REGDLPTHREPADDRSIYAPGGQLLICHVGSLVHRGEWTRRRHVPESGQVRRGHRYTSLEGRDLRRPHRGVEGERVQKQQAVGHGDPRPGGTTTRRAAGMTVKLAGRLPTRSPSA